MISDDLLEAAELLISGAAGRPTQAMLKRPVGTANYARLHARAYNNVDALLGWGLQSPRYWDIVSPVHRLFEHGPTKKALARLPRDHVQSDLFIRVGSAFAELQKQRMLSDDDPRPTFPLPAVRELIALAREPIADVRSLQRDDRRFLASRLIAKTRPGPKE